MREEVRFNGREVPHRSNPNVFMDQSGDRIWIERIRETDTIQIWAYEEDDGERGETFTVATVALDLEQTMKLQDFLGKHLKDLADKYREIERQKGAMA